MSFYVVTYVLGVYIMSVLLKYFTPLGLPDVDEDDDELDGRIFNIKFKV